MRRNARGSEWSKWDLHVHAPGGTYSDNYVKVDGSPDWDQFCKIINDSDVDAIGITDYFSLKNFFTFKAEYESRYGNSHSKVFFPNLELRLPEAVNRGGQSINIHLVFRPDMTEELAEKFLNALATELTVGEAQRILKCGELATGDFERATVSRANIEAAISETFGKHAVRADSVLLLVSARGDGIRPGGEGSKQRKYSLVDEIDKLVDGIFGAPDNRDHFLNVDRLETSDTASQRPVFAGCDAHSFEQLRQRLGQSVDEDGDVQHVTWVKADKTYEGLQQTFIEPEDRVAIQPFEPDKKEPYRFISKIKFSGSTDFPDEVVFNKNLNSIIGSRSSGKSALLAFVAHAVDPAETLKLQKEASQLPDTALGPAAGKTWAQVFHIDAVVEWGAGGSNGKVIYIPQNSLHAISLQPERINEKIEPALFRSYQDFRAIHLKLLQKIETANQDIESLIRSWFDLTSELRDFDKAVGDFGDKIAIGRERDSLQSQIDELKKSSTSSDKEIESYQALVETLALDERRLEVIVEAKGQLQHFVDASMLPVSALPNTVSIDIVSRPATSQMPAGLALIVEESILNASASLATSIGSQIADFYAELVAEESALQIKSPQVLKDNAELIEKNKKNVVLGKAIEDHKTQVSLIARIREQETEREKVVVRRGRVLVEITKLLASRMADAEELAVNFRSEPRRLEDLTFGIEVDVDPERLQHISGQFNLRARGDYVLAGDTPAADLSKAQSNPGDFLSQLESGDQKLKLGFVPRQAATDILTASPVVRFTAELEGDTIGGFKLSSMTPGKQALFALTLILNESQEPWPLLIDQPEDDLDSRSIYDTIVPYLARRKKERQIIMVTHNANLVVGADSEEVIVANRHGDDRKNVDGRMFEYLSGPLEHSEKEKTARTELATRGIREHACKILDGGEIAFQKRKLKYKI